MKTKYLITFFLIVNLYAQINTDDPDYKKGYECKTDEAIGYYSKYLDKYPKDAYVYLLRGFRYKNVPDIQKALDDFRQ